MMIRDVRLVAYCRTFLDLSWDWLNDPEIKALTMTPDFSRADQEAFYASLPERGDYRIWGIETSDGSPIGACGIKKIAGKTGEFWCYIGNKRFWGQGLGGTIVRLCEDEARKLGLNELTMIVDRANHRSLGAFLKGGYCEDAVQPDPMIVSMTKQLEA